MNCPGLDLCTSYPLNHTSLGFAIVDRIKCIVHVHTRCITEPRQYRERHLVGSVTKLTIRTRAECGRIEDITSFYKEKGSLGIASICTPYAYPPTLFFPPTHLSRPPLGDTIENRGQGRGKNEGAFRD